MIIRSKRYSKRHCGFMFNRHRCGDKTLNSIVVREHCVTMNRILPLIHGGEIEIVGRSLSSGGLNNYNSLNYYMSLACQVMRVLSELLGEKYISISKFWSIKTGAEQIIIHQRITYKDFVVRSPYLAMHTCLM